MLPDADAEQPVRGDERDLDRFPRGITFGAGRRRDIATGQLRDEEGPAREPEHLDDGRGAPDDDAREGQRRRGVQDGCDERHDREQRAALQRRACQRRMRPEPPAWKRRRIVSGDSRRMLG